MMSFEACSFIFSFIFMMIHAILTFIPALIFQGITTFRNFLFDQGICKSEKFKKPTIIVVGNLAVGGTGKSPLVSYLVKNWPFSSEIGILSRGYGRKNKGFRWVNSNASFKEVGDEPLTYKLQFPHISVAVDEKRVAGIHQMISDYPFLDAIVLDDAFQHRSLSAHLNIICTTFDHPFFEDFLMPMGRLRESRKGIDRAQVLLVNRCPSFFDQAAFLNRLKGNISKNIPVFFTRVAYGQPIGPPTKKSGQNWHVLVGIADPFPFIKQVNEYGQIRSERIFKDHHTFSDQELKDLDSQAQTFSEGEAFITTHKDFVRFLSSKELFPFLFQNLFYVPMEMVFVQQENEFWDWMKLNMKR